MKVFRPRPTTTGGTQPPAAAEAGAAGAVPAAAAAAYAAAAVSPEAAAAAAMAAAASPCKRPWTAAQAGSDAGWGWAGAAGLASPGVVAGPAPTACKK